MHRRASLAGARPAGKKKKPKRLFASWAAHRLLAASGKKQKRATGPTAEVAALLRNLPDPLPEVMGTALYSQLSQLNHSCEPNCWTYFEHGKHVQVRTLRAIAPGASASEGSSSHPLGAPSSAPRELSVPLCRGLGEAPCCANSALAPTECASLIWVCLCTACAGATGEPLTIAYVNPPAPRFARQAELKTNYFFDCACERWVLYRLYRPALLALTLKTSRYRAMRWVAPVRGGRVVV